jgi:arginyl-tRNA--protein-N-Asp/Glu arginylyltransferase
MSKLARDMKYVKTYLDDLLMAMSVNASKSTFFAEHIEYLGYWITKRESSQFKVRWKPSSKSRLQKPEKNYATSLAYSTTNATCNFVAVSY